MSRTPITTLMASGWANYGGGFGPLSGYKNADGLCVISGLIKCIPGGGAALAAGQPQTVATLSSSAGELAVGAVSPVGPATIRIGNTYYPGLCFLTSEDFLCLQAAVAGEPNWASWNLAYSV